MSNVLLAAVSAVLYALVQYVDQKVIKKEKPQPRNIFKYSTLVFVCVFIACFIAEQFKEIGISETVSGITGGDSKSAQVFTDAPGF